MAVLEAKATGDRAALVATALEFWQAAPEPQVDLIGDPGAREVWRALVDARAVADAVAAALPVMRAGRPLRPYAYVDLVESILDPAVLFELADAALAHDLHPLLYLGPPCFALLDAGGHELLWQWIQRHADALRATTDRWVFVGVILTTSKVGKQPDLAAWFAGFDRRAGVPMWIVAAYLCARLQVGHALGQLVDDARAALATARRDHTASLCVAIVLVAHLQRDELDEFFALLAREPAIGWPVAEANPIVGYVNLAKHARPVTRADLAFDYGHNDVAHSASSLTNARRPPNWRLGVLLQEPADWMHKLAHSVGHLVRLRDLPAHDPAIAAMWKELRDVQPFVAVWQAWRRLAATKLTWWAHFKLKNL